MRIVVARNIGFHRSSHRFRAAMQVCLKCHYQLRGFTLVELLVVITIIGVLTSLITVAAVGALRKARESEIKAEINQIDAALEEYKNKTTAYPPNCQIDGIPPSQRPLDERTVFNDVKRHFKQAFPRHQENELLIAALVELQSRLSDDYPKVLGGGMSAAEAIVFWLGGFSSDPKYPISGEGGPAYQVPAFDDPDNRKLDPIESRSWAFPFDISRLQPRAPDGYFDHSSNRYIEYRDPKGIIRRINFWQYTPRKSEQSYLYFDTSRYPAAVLDTNGNIRSTYDPPAASVRSTERSTDLGLNVYAFKRASTSNPQVPIEFVNSGKFQILHCGVDEAWGTDAFERMSAIGLEQKGRDPKNVNEYLLFPDGPFTDDVADTIANFTNTTRIEDSQR